MLVFSTRSILLAIGTVHGLVLAGLLLRARSNRTANRLLALLLAVVALRILPYIIGFAGFYDAYPWLSFLPYDFALGYGALIWLYTRVVCTGALPAHWKLHLVPAAVQGAYYCVLFVQPLSFKDHWDQTVHVPRIVPVELTWSLSAMCVYLVLAWREHARYQRWLDDDLSNREEFRLTWLRIFLTAFGVTLAFWTGTALVDALVTDLDYFDLFPLYLWFSLLIYGLGLGGIRGANLAYPRPVTAAGLPQPGPVVDPAAESGGSVPVPDTVGAATDPGHQPGDVRPVPGAERQQDWAAMAARWSALVRAEGWWRDPDLTAPLLSRRLATNTTYLSRALNEGLGQNFNEFVNRLRVEAVQAELMRPDLNRDLLTVARDAGFSSKASFNRVFKRLTGSTPTDFRRTQTRSTSQNR